MRSLLFVLLLMAFMCPVKGQVAGGEYFIDTDPGYGRGNAINVAAGDDVSKDFNAVLSSVSPGFHIVYLRIIDAQRRWSQTVPHPFYIGQARASVVRGSEYFIDTDPGIAKATPVPVALGTDSSLKFIVPLSSLTTGFHHLGLRSFDENSTWSQTISHTFYINENSELVDITALQYYFKGSGANNDIYQYDIPTPAPMVDLNFKADLSKLVADREYEMHIWAVNAKGVKSEVLIKKIKACDNEPAKAGFDFIPMGTQVSFTDSSRGKLKYQWSFGDGTTDSVSNPLHAYAAGGNYTVKQVVSNFCNSDTVTRLVSVLSLRSIYPSVGGNKGTVTFSIKGAGFSANSSIRLLPTSGGGEIKADSVLVNITGSILTGMLNLNGKQPGVYNVVVNTNNSFDTLKLAFVIQQGEVPDVFVDLIGRDVIRGNGIEQMYTIHFGNKSNNDVYAMPLWIAGLPKTARWRLYATVDTVDENNNPTPIEVIMDDSSKAIPLIISRLPAKSDFTVELGIAVPAIGDTIQLMSWLSRPLFSAAATAEEEPSYQSVRSLINYATGKITGAALSPGCLTESAKAFYGSLKNITVRQPVVNPSAPRFFSSYTRLLIETGKTISACAGNVLGSSYEAFYKNFLGPLYELEKHSGDVRK